MTTGDGTQVSFSRAAWGAWLTMAIGPAIAIGIPLLVWGYSMGSRITKLETILEYHKSAYDMSLANGIVLARIEISLASQEKALDDSLERIKKLEERK